MRRNSSTQRSETLSSLKNKGTYILFLFLDRDCVIEVGKIGKIPFKKGFYLYVGSAMNGFNVRIKRYIHGGKRKHWHIDYFLEIAHLEAILLIPSEVRIEEAVASRLSSMFENIKGFGSSDTRLPSHLFYAGYPGNIPSK